jgi:alpha-glucosidase
MLKRSCKTRYPGFLAVLLACFLAILGTCTDLLAQTITVGSVTGASVQTESGKQKAVLTLSTGGTCEITPYAADLVRVRFHWSALQPHEDVAIDKTLDEWPALTPTFTNGTSTYTIETSQLIVEVTKSPNILINFKDKTQSGQYLLKDKKMEYDTGYNPVGDTTFRLLKSSNDIANWYRVRVVKESPAQEAYFGLGEVPFTLNRRGQVVQGWNSDAFYWNAEKNPMYMTMPFMYGVQAPSAGHPGFAYGVFFNNPARPLFMFQKQRPSSGAQRNSLSTVNDQYSFEATEGYVDYFFFGGGGNHTTQEVLARYTELTGPPALPAKWAMGHHLSRWTYTEDQMRNIATTARTQGYPLDAIYFDIDYMDVNPHVVPPGGTFADNEYRGANDLRALTFQAHPTNTNYWFKNGPDLISTLQAANIKCVPLIEAWLATTDPLWTESNGLGHLVKTNAGASAVTELFFGTTSWIDFTNSTALTWWRGKQVNYLNSYPFDGIWNDLNEQADERDTIAESAPIPLNGLYSMDGRYGSSTTDYRRQQIYVKNTYNVYQARNTYDTLLNKYPTKRPFVLSRAGWPGIQRYAFNWSGDNVNESAGASYGQQGSLRVGLSTMISGQVFFGHDLGGFLGNVSSASMTRWAEWCSLMPFFRNHSGKWDQLREPWLYADAPKIKAAIEFRYQLMPYLYTLARQASVNGQPLNSPLFYHFQKDANTFNASSDFDFMVGPYLLASPVHQTGATTRATYLPSGVTWYYWHDGAQHAGGNTITKSAPLGTIPLYVKEGGIIPMGPVQQYANQNKPAQLTLNVWPSAAASSFTLYEDDGQSFDYTGTGYASTQLSSSITGGTWSFTIGAKQGSYDHGHTSYLVVRHALNTAPGSVTIGGVAATSYGSLANLQSNASGYFYDSAAKKLYVKTSQTASQVVINASDSTPTQIKLYYTSDWAQRIHFDANVDGSWTTFPGELLTTSEFDGVKTYTISASSAEFAFTDTGANWDNNGGSNYVINAPGTYTVDPISRTITSGPPTTFTIHYLPPTGWTSAKMHWKANGGQWTSGTGFAMGTSTQDDDYFELKLYAAQLTEFAFNTSSGATWENNNNANYSILTPGTYTIKASDHSITPGAPGGIKLFYETSWSPAYIHYNADSTGWTTAPGVTMGNTALSNFKYIQINANNLQFVFNNGSGTWDNNGGSNYTITQPGRYTVGFGGNLLPGYNPIRFQLYYKTAFSPTTYIHYNVDSGGWTTAPGELMPASADFSTYTFASIEGTTLTAAFTDNGTTWDNNLGSNYNLTAPGIYTIDPATHTVTAGYPGITLYYSTGWSTANIHYSANGGAWTTSPGVAMTSSTYTGYKKATITANTLAFVLNNGSGTWDNNGGLNYSISARGIYTLTNGVLRAGPPTP